MKHLPAALAVGSLFAVVPVGLAQTGNTFYDPAGGWTYVYSGDRADGLPEPGGLALDGTWRNDNGSDRWDGLGRGVGVGAIGGVATRNGVLTIEDASSSATDLNRKLYFVHDVSQNQIVDDAWLDNGVTLYFRTRLTPGNDPSLELPNAPNGYGIFNSGKGTFSLRQAGPTGGTSAGIISFSLVNATEDTSPDGSVDFGQSGLTMNRLTGDESGGSEVDSAGDVGLNLVPLDPSQYHEFWITIKGNGDLPGTHEATIYIDGIASQNYTFELTSGLGDEGLAFPNYIGMGAPSSFATGSLDVDFLAIKTGIHAPVSVPEPSALALLGVGAFALGGWSLRRRN